MPGHRLIRRLVRSIRDLRYEFEFAGVPYIELASIGQEAI